MWQMKNLNAIVWLYRGETEKYSKLLEEYGIAIKTENYAGKMHSKSMIVDDKYTIIGSMNFSKP